MHEGTQGKATTKAPGKTPPLPLSSPPLTEIVSFYSKKKTSQDTEGLNPCGKRYYIGFPCPGDAERNPFHPQRFPGKPRSLREKAAPQEPGGSSLTLRRFALFVAKTFSGAKHFLDPGDDIPSEVTGRKATVKPSVGGEQFSCAFRLLLFSPDS